MAPCMQWALPMREDLFLLSRFAPRKNSSIPFRDFTLVLIVATIQATLQQLRIVRRFEKDRYHFHQRTSEANVHASRVSPFLTRNGASAISVRFIHGGRKPQCCDLWHNYEVGGVGSEGQWVHDKALPYWISLTLNVKWCAMWEILSDRSSLHLQTLNKELKD